MLTYNTGLNKLILPEYGRNIQKMVEYCVGIPDWEERTVCAYNIVDIMEGMFPPEGDPEEYRRKLWDQLAIMSDFKLEIDWPYPVIQPDELDTRPIPIERPQVGLAYRQYGRMIPTMIEVAANMPEGEEKDALVLLLANHLKKQMLVLNPDGVDDERVFNELRHISKGALVIMPGQMELCEFKTLPLPKKKKKK